MPIVSVLVPIYNVEKYVIQCLDSIKNQTFTDFECILIDDTSTDNSYSIVKSYIENDDRFKLYQIPHSGLSVVRNKGVELATGKYIYFCDSDDYLHLKLLEETIPYAEENDLDMLFFDANTICDTENKQQCAIERFYFNKKIKEMIASGEDYFNYCFVRHSLVLTSYNYVIRKDCLKYPFYPGIYYQCELHTVENMLLQNKIGHIPKILYCKRTRDNSSLSQNKTSKHIYSYYVIMEQLKEYTKNHTFSRYTKQKLDRIIKKFPRILKSLYENVVDKENISTEIMELIKK